MTRLPTSREAEDQAVRREIATKVLLALVERHDAGQYDRALAGRAVAYADDLIKTLAERGG